MGRTIYTLGAKGIAILGAIFLSAVSAPLMAETCPMEVEWESIFDSGIDDGTMYPSYEWGTDVAEDSAGNIVACGSQLVAQDASKWRVEKFDPKGESLWVDTWAPEGGSGFIIAWKLAVAPDDSIVVAGTCQIPKLSVIRKYSPEGAVLWTYSNSGSYLMSAIAVDQSGTILVGCRNIEGYDGFGLLKLDPYGNPIWLEQTDIPALAVNDLAILPNGDSVAVGALFYSDPVTFKPFVIRSDTFGKQKWLLVYGTGTTGMATSVVSDPERQCFYVSSFGGYMQPKLSKFPDDPNATQGIPDWMGDIAYINAMDLDLSGNIVATGQSYSAWTIRRYDVTSLPSQPATLICSLSADDLVDGYGKRTGHETQDSGRGNGIAYTHDGGIAYCGNYMPTGTSNESDFQVVKLAPANPRKCGPGPVAKGNPTGPGADHEHGMKPGEVNVVGGSAGYIDPRRGQGASVSVYPTSAGTVTLTVIDRKGGVVKQVSAPTSGSGVITLTWDGKNASGAPVAPGIYAVRVEGPGIRQVSKVAVVY